MFSSIVVLFIGYLDFRTGSELSFSIFYLVPVAFLALYRDSRLAFIIILSFIAGCVWLIADLLSHDVYSNNLIPYWNGLVRLVIFILVGSLIYNLKSKQQELQDTNRRLTLLNNEKNKYLGIAAHDLRNPMSTMIAFSNLIIDNPGVYHANSETLEIIHLLKQTGEYSLQMLVDLLDVSKIESGQIQIELIQTDYVEFVKHQVKINQMLAHTKNIEIETSFSTPVIMLKFDKHYMVDVISNLLTNAIKYSYPHSKVKVVVSLKNDHVLTEIIDQGVGIPEEEHDLLFRLFQKTSAKTTAGESSTGLGLAIAKKVVMLHKGEIGVKSKKGEGSNFYYTLPLG